MKVKMLVSMAGPEESWKPGDVREVSEAVAKEWQDAGISTTMPDGDAVVQAETAVVQAEEQAVEPDAEPEATPEPTVDELRAELDAMGVKYHHKAGAAKLAEILAAAKAETKPEAQE